MNITICGSITFYEEMKSLVEDLKKIGFKDVLWPVGIGGGEKEYKETLNQEKDGDRKIEHDLINTHYRKILKSDCIIVANHDKKGIKGYIGGNTFLEMGFAFVLGKPIFVLNPLPEMPYSSELIGMQPIILDGDITKIKNYYKLG